MGEIMRRSSRAFVASLGVCFLVLCSSFGFAASQASTNWLKAADFFCRSGGLIEVTNLSPAREQLTAASAALPQPYDTMARKFLEQLTVASKLAVGDATHSRESSLVTLAAALGAYGNALKLQAAFCDTDALQEDQAYAWRLMESGRTQEAVAEYQRRIKDEMVETFAEHFRGQLALIAARATNGNSVPLALQTVRDHYLRGFEEQADSFGALREFHRVLPQARNSAESVTVIGEIIRRLASFNDEAGRDSWEDEILNRFPNEREACASVILDRGLRAYAVTNYPVALELFGNVISSYGETKAFGDAQFTVGLIRQIERRYDDAIREFGKIFPSHVRDHDLDVNKSEDCKNYRYRAALHISECYASKKDFAQALSFAEAARDRHVYVSFCKNCIRDARENLERTLANLKQQIADGAAKTAK
jgi:tetratricopeptide (TPR) repeat protein